MPPFPWSSVSFPWSCFLLRVATACAWQSVIISLPCITVTRMIMKRLYKAPLGAQKWDSVCPRLCRGSFQNSDEPWRWLAYLSAGWTGFFLLLLMLSRALSRKQVWLQSRFFFLSLAEDFHWLGTIGEVWATHAFSAVVPSSRKPNLSLSYGWRQNGDFKVFLFLCAGIYGTLTLLTV